MKILALRITTNIEEGFHINLYNCFAKRELLKAASSWKPKPPYCLGISIFFQLNQ